MYTNIRYILLTALRDRLFAGLLLGVLAVAMVASLMGNMAMVEQNQLRLVYAGAGVRLVLVVGLIVFVCFHVRNAFDAKEIDVFLSRPISRANLVFSYWLGFAVLATVLALPTFAVIWWVGVLDGAGFALWSAGLWLELLLVVAVGLFCAFTLKSAVTSVLASMGFYVLSRMMGFFIATASSSLLFRDAGLNMLSEKVMKGFAIVVPRLDFFAKSEWLVYGVEMTEDVWLMVLQAGVFIPLLVFAAIVDFRRKQF